MNSVPASISCYLVWQVRTEKVESALQIFGLSLTLELELYLGQILLVRVL